MRRVLSFIGALSASPVIIAIPVASLPHAKPHSVAPHTQLIALHPTPATRGVIASTSATHTGPYGLVGATWNGGALPQSVNVQVRSHADGKWSSWTDLQTPDGGPDAGSADARAAAARHLTSTDPVWVGSADGVQARVVDSSGKAATAPSGLHLVLVDGGSSGADAHPGAPTTLGGTAEAAQSQPTIYTRAQWGADESLRYHNSGCGSPSYGSTIKMGFIHHTDTANGYSAGSVPSIIRSIYAYHVESNGWCDIGYNFLVDRFGRIWEGRYGGITQPVIGAHTGGFNTDTFGASLIGNYTATAPSSAMLGAVEKLFAWKLGGYYRNPLSKTTTTAGSFSGSRYAAGASVTFNVISGHRDADETTCPGNSGYAKLPSVRSAVLADMGAGFVSPSVSPSTVRMLSGQGFTIKAGVITAQSWTASIANSAGVVVRTLTGNASTSSAVASVWDGTGANGLPVAPDTYTVTLTGANAAGQAAVPYVTKVTVTPPVTISGPTTTPYGAATTLSGTAAPNAPVSVNLQSAAPGATPVTQTVTATAAGTWKTVFTADNDYTWSATSQGFSTTTKSTKVAPTITAPAGTVGHNVFTTAGGVITLSGSALPGTTVTGPGNISVPVDASGAWTGLAVTPTTTPLTLVVKDARGLSSNSFTAYGVAAPTATGPATGYSQRTLTLTGNAGNAPVSVQLWTEPAGATSYTLASTVTAAPTGAYAVSTALPQVSVATPFAWRIVTTAAGQTFGTVDGTVSAQPTFAPTISGPTVGSYGSTMTLTGNAVPGDTVTLYTRPTSGGSWGKVMATTTSSTGVWRATFVLNKDTTWAVKSPSGASPSGNTRIRPSLHVPATAAQGATITGWGWMLPGAKVAVYRRPVGTTTWSYIGTVTTASSGRWIGHWHLIYPMDVQARSNNQVSPTYTIRSS